MRYFPDTFQPAPDVLALAVTLIRTTEGFRHLARLRLGCLSSQRALIDRGENVPAQLIPPAQVTGKGIDRQVLEWALAQLLMPQYVGELPDFILWVDAALWSGSDTLAKERIVFHELSHLEQKRDSYDCPQFDRDGRPTLRLRPHDAELFYSEVLRYGPAVPAFAETAIAIADATNRLKPRKLA